MSKQYRIIFECYESSPEAQQVLSRTIMMAGSIEKPEDVFNFRPPDPDEFKLPLIYKLTANLSPEKSYLFHLSPHKDAAKLCPKHDLRGDVI